MARLAAGWVVGSVLGVRLAARPTLRRKLVRMRVSLLLLGLGLFFFAGCGTASRTVVKVSTQTRTTTTVRTVKEVTTVAATSKPTIYVDTPTGLLFKPDAMTYYGGHQVIERIRWLAYGDAVAVGRAEFGRDDCNPNCAEGQYTFTSITVKLMDRALCHGVTAYRRWTLVGAGLDPTPGYITGPLGGPCP